MEHCYTLPLLKPFYGVYLQSLHICPHSLYSELPSRECVTCAVRMLHGTLKYRAEGFKFL
jgi:hypothetical protein